MTNAFTLSGSTDLPETKRRAASKGVVGTLLKPFDMVRRELANKRGLGVLNTCTRMLSIAFHAHQHWQVVRAIGGTHTRDLLNSYSRAVYRYTLPYLSMNFKRSERQKMLKGHYDFVNTALNGSFFSRVLSDCMVLWQHESDDGHCFSISVGGPCMHREGDLTLVFKMNGAPLYRIAFSVLPLQLLNIRQLPQQPASESIIYVGQVQGYPGGFEQIRQATKLCRDVAPADLLMAAVSGFAESMGINMVAGVGYENSLSYHNLMKLNSNFSYAEFWEKHHGIRSEGGHYILQVPLLEKPINLIKANHRGRTVLKREFKKAVSDEAERIMRPLVLKQRH